MNKKPNTEAMREFSQAKAEQNRQRVLDAIDLCKKEGNISTNRVCELAGVTRAYFTNHKDMRIVLDKAKGIVNRNLKKKRQSPSSRDTLETALRCEIKMLKKQICELEDNENYKEKYEQLKEENRILNERLSKDLTDNSFFNF